MERVVPWSALCTLIEPFYPKPGNGRPPVGVERMLRFIFLQQWFNLSDPAVEEALHESLAIRRFCRDRSQPRAGAGRDHGVPYPPRALKNTIWGGPLFDEDIVTVTGGVPRSSEVRP